MWDVRNEFNRNSDAFRAMDSGVPARLAVKGRLLLSLM